jgi:hypothetical protein
MIDPIDLIRRAHKAGAITDTEMRSLQDGYAERCSFHADRPAKIRDDRLFLCEECAKDHMPRILERERGRNGVVVQ